MFFAFLSNTDRSRIWFVISYPGTFCKWRQDILPDLEACVPGWAIAIFIVLFCLQMFFAFLSNTAGSRIWFVISHPGTFCEWRQDILPDLEACVPGWATAIFFVLFCHQMFFWAIPPVVEFDLWYLILVHFASRGGRTSCQILKHVYQDERPQYFLFYFATKCFSFSWAIPPVVEFDLWYLILVHFASGGRTSCQILKHVYQDERPQYFLFYFATKCFFEQYRR